MQGDRLSITDTLKAYRPERWRENKSDAAPLTTTVSVKMTLEELQERLRQLGIELPVLRELIPLKELQLVTVFEGDQVEDHMIPLTEDVAARKAEDDTSRD